MVVFICNDCGQSMKKNQVEKHCAFKCRNFNLSCLDCNKDFWGQEYVAHIKCISEDQKYGGKDYKPKENANKGEKKQIAWIEHIKNTLATKKTPPALSALLKEMIQFENIPKKKSKFENFLTHNLKVRNKELVNKVWDIFEAGVKTGPQASETNSTNSSSNTASESVNMNGLKNTAVTSSNIAPGCENMNGFNNSSVKSSNSSQKRPCDNDSIQPSKKMCTASQSLNDNAVGNFNWLEVARQVLQSSPDKSLSMRDLRKKVIAQFKAGVGKSCTASAEELKQVFKSAILSGEIFVISKNRTK